jgi:hypothetical protein
MEVIIPYCRYPRPIMMRVDRPVSRGVSLAIRIGHRLEVFQWPLDVIQLRQDWSQLRRPPWER